MSKNIMSGFDIFKLKNACLLFNYYMYVMKCYFRMKK